MSSFFLGWAARLGRLLITRGLGSDGDVPPPVTDRTPCLAISQPRALVDLTISPPVGLLDLAISQPRAIVDLSLSQPQEC